MSRKAMKCPDCNGSGKVRGLCYECGEPLRDCGHGVTCLECVEDIEQHGVAHLDTRPDDRMAQARKRWRDLSSLAHDAVRIERAHMLLAATGRAWAWLRRWDEAVAR